MQVPDPQTKVIKIGKTSYRCNQVISQLGGQSRTFLSEEDTADLDELALIGDISKDSMTGACTLVVQIPRVFHGFLIGKDNKKRTTIQQECRCTIGFPPRGSTSTSVVIKANSEKDLLAAHSMISLEIEHSKEVFHYTHFINIPLGFDPAFIECLTEFRENILLENAHARGMDESIVLQPWRMHLTLLTMKAFTDEDEAKIQSIFAQSVNEIAEIIGDEPLKIHLKGIELMNDDPTECHVLYLDVYEDESKDKLIAISDFFKQLFGRAGVVVEEERVPGAKIKLHATLINTKKRELPESDSKTGEGKNSDSPKRKEFVKRIPVDCSGIVAKDGRRDFGVFLAPQLHLSRMGQAQEHLRPLPARPPPPLFLSPETKAGYAQTASSSSSSSSSTSTSSAESDKKTVPVIEGYYECLHRMIL
ncbi:putative KH domain containing protein [Monocercomonoides exilis]|uniref:putative KH domain containing protein n=1 Tax=Monocercomonoides exilis TaxID=2049356 RepID=UPI00355A6454|nr:putative KH domain containing protein [Monocercomonoides exilis]|eukprot:MONOS_12901.1-p1 / transcript=MONOS_12901.1 / gene=MONOS_12901 / organism=Monocercomonoides_exilis_PA203 / gene_product=KH domain containing protein / transcript_product=KH domain containing protein / location=Mono_scaffold00748:23070-24464(+) / protein_length=418 / sequence_SO=supercontig / SO=protein_coding / is_pseudo=false